MKIEFSPHALEQLTIRERITKKMVKEAVENSDKLAQSYRGRQIFHKKYGTETLEVVAIKEDNKIVIITQYILD